MSLLSTSDARRIFHSLDQNNDGFLSLDELKWLLEKIGVHASEDELASLVGKDGLDIDKFCYFYESILLNKHHNIVNDGAQNDDDFDDFADEIDHYVQEEGEDSDEDEESDLYKAFKVFDLNDDGLISSQELQSVLWKLGMWGKNGGLLDMDRIMSKYDVNSDGFVDFSEFKIMMLAY